MGFDDSIVSEYIAESREHLADIEGDLLTMEGMGASIDEPLVNKVFRAAHSIKGGAGFLGFTKIQELAHKIENVLDMIRSREMVPNPEVINILLIAFDRLKDLLSHHETSASEDISDLVVSLTGLASSHLPPEQKASLTTEVKLADLGFNTLIGISEFDLNRARMGGNYVYLVEYDLIHDIHQAGKNPLDVIRALQAAGNILGVALDFSSVGTLDDEPVASIPFHVLYATIMDPDISVAFFEVPKERVHMIEERSSAAQTRAKTPAPASPETSAQVAEAVQTAPAPREEKAAERSQTAQTGKTGAQSAGTPTQGDATLRVSVGLLEQLMTLAGELVLSRNQLTDAIDKKDQRLITASSQHINLVTSELQETIMITRMQPIGNVLNKFPRVVRDMARDLGKEIRLEITGNETEMDKTLIEGLSDPLTHMVRNAVDHGVEAPDDRAKAGKDRTGVIRIRACHEAGQVVIAISDDGKGLDPEKVADAALSKGLVSQDILKTMSDKEKMALVFLPGLSTATKVSDISGRGVGMDVVKTNLDKLSGQVEITSEKGAGTTFTIKLPLTLAIIPSLLVSVDAERFAIPQVSVSELIRIPAEQVKKRIEVVGKAEVLNLRGIIIPIIRLADALGIERFFQGEDGEALPDRRERIADRRAGLPVMAEDARQWDERLESEGRRWHATSDLNIVVVNTGAMQYGLVVDELHDTTEIVVKPIGRHIKHRREYAGTTILGDGRVALILDVGGLAAMAGLTSLAGNARAQELTREAMTERLQDMSSFLTFRNSPREVCAVPLELVTRIEQISPEQVEVLGSRRTIQYRGASLPLVTLRDAAQVEEIGENQPLVVIVFSIGGRDVGLLASMPVDVLESNAAIDQSTLKQKGIMGSAIIKGDTVLVVDIFELVDTIHPEWTVERRQDRPSTDGVTILLAEDSDFFRSQVKRFMEGDGYRVLAAEDGQAAWEILLQNPEDVSLVVTDIEMPRMNGLGLTQNIRSDSRFDSLPIIALTSLASEEDIARGKAAGVTDYQVKLDKENLLQSIHQHLNVPAGAGV